MKDLPNLDLLRSIAVLLVVFAHTCIAMRFFLFHSWELGYLGSAGVFIFFVHTALVLMWSLERRPHTLDFYIRRVFRIYPLSIVALTLAILLRAPVSDNVGRNFEFVYVQTTLVQKILHYLLLQNLHHGNLIVAVMWSLPLEMQMYLLLPVIFFFIRENFSLWPLTILWLLTVAFCISSFRTNELNLITVTPLFLPGLMAYVGFGRRVPRWPAWCFGIFVAVLLFSFMLHPRIWNGWPLCLALGLGLPSFRQIQAGWLVRITKEIAQYSYGIYLGHPFLLALFFYHFRTHSLAFKLSMFLLSLPVVVFASYHLIERPLIRLGSRVAAHLEFRYEQFQLSQFRADPTQRT